MWVCDGSFEARIRERPCFEKASLSQTIGVERERDGRGRVRRVLEYRIKYVIL